MSRNPTVNLTFKIMQNFKAVQVGDEIKLHHVVVKKAEAPSSAPPICIKNKRAGAS